MRTLFPLRKNAYWSRLSKQERAAIRTPHQRAGFSRNWKDWRTWVALLILCAGISGLGGVVDAIGPRVIIGALSGLIVGLIWEHQIQRSIIKAISGLEQDGEHGDASDSSPANGSEPDDD